MNKIIHQIWFSPDSPSQFTPYISTWREFLPKWEYKFWTAHTSSKFVEHNYPEYLDTYKSLARLVEKADFLRYLVIYHYGGIYADIDTSCVRSLDNLITENDQFICCVEKIHKTKREMQIWKYARQLQLCQWFFYAQKGSHILKNIFAFIKLNHKNIKDHDREIEVINKTGPGIFTDFVLQYKYNPEIKIYPQYLFATGACQTTGFDDEYPNFIEKCDPSENNIYVLHHFAGWWKRESGT